VTGAAGAASPTRDCPLCPRLVTFRSRWRLAEPGWHNSPVPSFGPADARLLVVGLAPGLRGANRTGRPFTGDGAGLVLYPALIRAGFAAGDYRAAPDDGLLLQDCRITNAVRCVPPENRPSGAETALCRRFLLPELQGPPPPAVVLALGRLAHGSVLAAQGLRAAAHPFAHGALFRPPGTPALLACYHCSRYNVNTGRLTVAMLDAVLARARGLLDAIDG
jgi:uracil-DNA glycosylase